MGARSQGRPKRAFRFLVKRLTSSVRYRTRLALRTCLAGTLGASRRIWGDRGGLSRFLRRSLWQTDRFYRPRVETKKNWLTMDLKDTLSRIAGGGTATQAELLPYLCLGAQDERAQVNALLADAYSLQPNAERLAQAKIFAQRAWLLSNFSPSLLPLYIRILSALGDTDDIREAYKRLGAKAAARGDVAEAIKYFDAWHTAYYLIDHQDKFEYDFDILGYLDDLATARRPVDDKKVEPESNGRIRLAYLVRGATESNSILMKITQEFAKLHDRSRFEITFFFPETPLQLAASTQGSEHIERFTAAGWAVMTAAESDDLEAKLLGLAARIREWRPDLLVTSGALADFSHYFITALRPAPRIVGLVQGPPPQFVPPSLDWCISWSRHPLMDTPVGCSLVKLHLSPTASDETPYIREDLGLPKNARVLLSGGRHVKFQNPDFWRSIADVMAANQDTYYLVAGPSDDQVPFIDQIIPAEIRPRIHLLGWRNDFERITGAADIIVDTYPNGGGLVLVEAMWRGLPVVSHRNDYMQLFDQTNWSPVEDFIEDSELIVPRGDFERFRRVLSRLVTDDEYRLRMGERCREQVMQGDPEKSVRCCEEIYEELVRGRGPDICDGL